tara:strand:+ start:5604 stop:6584 length:981 start_codon:yes stop_codon:yes gene_type:complete
MYLKAKVRSQDKILNYVRHYPVRTILRSVFFPIELSQKIFRLLFFTKSSGPKGSEINRKHYKLLHGNQGNYCKIVSEKLETADSGHDCSKVNIISDNEKLAIVHSYYREEAIEALNHLKEFHDYDVVVTSPLEDMYALAADIIPSERLFFFQTENRGRDVLPFLLVCNYLDIKKYKYFLKFHTKRSSHLSDGGFWFYQNLYALLGSHTLNSQLLDLIGSDKPVIAGVKSLELKDHFKQNRKWLRFLITNIDGIDNGSFIAGTMFLGNKLFLENLQKEKMHELPFENENGQLDGTLAHAIERFIGYYALLCGGRCVDFEELFKLRRS